MAEGEDSLCSEAIHVALYDKYVGYIIGLIASKNFLDSVMIFIIS